MRLNKCWLYCNKKRGRQATHTIVHSSIECFLEETCAPFDIVAFSSVLHHLYDYTSSSSKRRGLASWGIFYTSQDRSSRNIRLQLTYLTPWDITVAK